MTDFNLLDVGRLPAKAVALGCALLAGCAQLQQSKQSATDVRERAIAIRDANVASVTSSALQRTARPRLAGEEVVLRSQYSLPPFFQKEAGYKTEGAEAVSDVLDKISGRLAMPIRSGELAKTGESAGATHIAPNGQEVLTGRVQFSYKGTVKGLLDEVARIADASWRFLPATGAVEFFRFETRTLSVYLPPGSKSINANISLSGVSGGSGGSGGGSSGSVNVSQSMTVNPWQSVMAGIQTILGEQAASGGAAPAGASTAAASGAGAGAVMSVQGLHGRAAANPELGIVTITAKPLTLDRVAAYVESVNSRFARNVMVDVKIYNVSMDSQASYGFSLDLLYAKLNSYGVSIVGASPLQAGTGTPGQFTLTSQNSNSRWNGSQMVAQALSQFGNVSLQTQGQVIAINGQPSPMQIANELNYLESNSTTLTPNVGSQTAQRPGQRVLGFTANFIPTIQGDNRILLQYQMELSALTSMTQVVSGGTVAQFPQINKQSLQQQAFVRDGEAIVLFGFDQNRDTVDSALGLGSASQAGRTQREMIVIVMQVSGGRKHV